MVCASELKGTLLGTVALLNVPKLPAGITERPSSLKGLEQTYESKINIEVTEGAN